jgi:hypothetical protein
MSVTKQQIDAGLDKVWDDIQSTVGPLTVEEFKALLAKVLFPEEEKSDSEGSTASKRGRKKGPMSEDAKAAMVAKRKATLAAKAQAPKEDKPEPKVEEPKVAAIAVKMVKPKKVKEEKPKMSKEDRSAAAKARWESKTEEEKEAIKANLAAARAAKAAKAE